MRDVVFTILAIDEASRTLERVGLGADATGGKLGKFGSMAGMALGGVALAAGAAAIKGVELGASFQSSMELLHTEAHVSQGSVDQLSDKVLGLAGKVGTDPDSLSQALYHVESSFASTGISGQQAMHMLQTSAEGAKIGHANLVDVTNALDAAVVSGIPGVQNLDQAMGALTATVGAGDMSMQDLAEAFGGGNIAAVKTYGLNLRDVSASLALFGDNNLRGAEAGSALRMTVQALAVPAKAGKAALAELGLTSSTLGKDMQHGGLNAAVGDLVDHLHKAGIKGDATGQILTEAFGKKAGTGINMLVDQYDRLKGKYAEVDKGSKGFAESWAAQQKTFTQQWDQLKQSFDAGLTRLGLVLIPLLLTGLAQTEAFIGRMKTAFDGVGKNAFVSEMMPKLQEMGGKLAAVWDKLEAAGAKLWPHLVDGFNKIKAAVEPVILKIADTINADVIPALSDLVTAIEPVISWLVDKLSPIIAVEFKQMGTVIDGALKIISGIIEVVTGLITGHWGKAWHGIVEILSGDWEIIKGVVSNGIKVVEDIISAAGSELWNIGKAILDGLLGGLKSGWDTIKGFFTDLTSKIPDWKGPKAKDKVLLVEAGTTIIGGLLSGFRQAEPQVADYLKGLSDRISNIKISPKLKANLQQFADSVGASLDRDNTALKTLQGKISDQAKTVADLIKTRDDYAAKLADGVSGGGITSLSETTETTSADGTTTTRASTAVDFAASLQARLKAIKDFSANLAALKGRGVNDAMLQQIAASGIDTGGQLAAALTKGSPEVLKQITDLNGQITTASTGFGTKWAGDMYDQGVNAAQGVAAGLKSQEATLVAAVQKLADKLTGGIKSRLGVAGHAAGVQLASAIGVQLRPTIAAATPQARITAATPARAHADAAGGLHVHVEVKQGFVGSPDDLARAVRQVLVSGQTSGAIPKTVLA